MLSAGMRPTFARTRSPSTDGNPSRSSATTATETSPLRRPPRGPSVRPASVVGLVGPIPPETGKSGSGVITRIAAPTWISARAAGTTQHRSENGHGEKMAAHGCEPDVWVGLGPPSVLEDGGQSPTYETSA